MHPVFARLIDKIARASLSICAQPEVREPNAPGWTPQANLSLSAGRGSDPEAGPLGEFAKNSNSPRHRDSRPLNVKAPHELV